MGNSRKAVAARHARGPALDLFALDLEGLPARSAHDMVMMLSVRAAPVDGLAVRLPDDVDLAGLGKSLQCPVHRSQPNATSGGAEIIVEILSATKTVDGIERCSDIGALASGSHAVLCAASVIANDATAANAHAVMAPKTIVAPGATSA